MSSVRGHRLTGGGPVRFSGSLTETGTVTVAGSRATMTSPTNFLGYANLPAGTSTVSVAATDLSQNTSTNQYQLVITNNGVSKTLTYDLNGNLASTVTATSTNTFEWDAVDRLVRITQLSTTNPQPVTSEFTYDGQGRRIRIVEKSNGVVQSDKRFLWVTTDLAEERDTTGATVTKRFFGQGQQNITLNPQPSTLNLFYTFDHLGSVREMTDATGAIRARYDYDPYGRRTKVQGDLEADFGFTGHYFHPASGLYLAPYRAYDPDTARWISRDPLAEKGGLNLYAYVSNSPVSRVDPLGLACFDELMKQAYADMEYWARVMRDFRPGHPIWEAAKQSYLKAAQEYGAMSGASAGLFGLRAQLSAYGRSSALNVLRGSAYGSGAAAGAVAAVVGAAVAGVVAGLIINELPNPLTGTSIGQGVQDTFTYLFFTKGW